MCVTCAETHKLFPCQRGSQVTHKAVMPSRLKSQTATTTDKRASVSNAETQPRAFWKSFPLSASPSATVLGELLRPSHFSFPRDTGSSAKTEKWTVSFNRWFWRDFFGYFIPFMFLGKGAVILAMTPPGLPASPWRGLRVLAHGSLCAAGHRLCATERGTPVLSGPTPAGCHPPAPGSTLSFCPNFSIRGR